MRYTVALAVRTPPQTTVASLTLIVAAAGHRDIGALHGLVHSRRLGGLAWPGTTW